MAKGRGGVVAIVSSPGVAKFFMKELYGWRVEKRLWIGAWRGCTEEFSADGEEGRVEIGEIGRVELSDSFGDGLVSCFISDLNGFVGG